MGGLRGAALGGRRGDDSLTQEGLGELEWAVEPARSGASTLVLAGRYVHSRYDPEREAARLADETASTLQAQRAGLLVLVGAGLGHLPAALARRTSIPLLLWDPFPRVSAALGAVASVARRVSDPEQFDAALDALARPGLRPHLLVHPGYEEVARFETRWATRALRRRLAGSRPLAPERAIVSRRAVDALERLPYRGTIADLAGCLRDQTAIVVAAGPTLPEACAALARRPGGAVIAALQALPHLAEAGVRVDFAVVPDPLRIDPARLARFGDHVDALLADTSVEPELVDWRPERTFLFHLRTPQLHQVAWEACGLPILDEPLVTVAETSVVLAHRLGAQRFVLVGMDFRSEDPRYPVRFRTPGHEGRPVGTNSHYFHAARYLDALCRRLSAAGCGVDRVGDGLPLRGTRSLAPGDLDARLADCAPFQVPSVTRRGARERWERARELLGAVERGDLVPGERASLAPGDPRWSVFDPLPDPERRTACRAVLRRLERPPAPAPSAGPA